MNAVAEQSGALPALGTPMAGGLFCAAYLLLGMRRGLIVAPKQGGEFKGIWHEEYEAVESARSYVDGLSNTRAMAEVGSPIAQQALELRIGGFDDWHIAAQDQLELAYRYLKPSTRANYLYGRSGLNASALPATYPYAEGSPAQTLIEAFRTGGAEAFAEDEWYWTSTQRAGYSDYAWLQDFGYGNQDYGLKVNEYPVRAVRSIPI